MPFEALLGDGEGFGRVGTGRGFANGRYARRHEDSRKGRQKDGESALAVPKDNDRSASAPALGRSENESKPASGRGRAVVCNENCAEQRPASMNIEARVTETLG